MRLLFCLPFLLACQNVPVVQAPLQEEITVVGYVDHSRDPSRVDVEGPETTITIDVVLYRGTDTVGYDSWHFVNPSTEVFFDHGDWECKLSQAEPNHFNDLIMVLCVNVHGNWVGTKPIRCGKEWLRDEVDVLKRDETGGIDLTVMCETK